MNAKRVVTILQWPLDRPSLLPKTPEMKKDCQMFPPTAFVLANPQNSQKNPIRLCERTVLLIIRFPPSLSDWWAHPALYAILFLSLPYS